MEDIQAADQDQARLWNGIAGDAWVEAQTLLDQMFKPFEELLVAAAAAESAERVLDVGCGTGATTLALARAIGTEGRCTGIDLSAQMIAAARSRAEERENTSAQFLCADAQLHRFEPAAFDAVVSRFGVMFFADPVRAFANLRQAAREGAGLHMLVWRSPEENAFMTTAERAAAPLLPEVPARAPGAPGQFAFADAERVRRILEDSGWNEVEIRPVDAVCSLPERDLVRFFTRLGPLGQILPQVDDRTRERIVERVRVAFEPFVQGAEVRYSAACWRVSARAPSCDA